MVAFRIVKRRFAGSAFSGAGARLFGGRWNTVGTPLIYTAGSLSLAILEWRMHLADWPALPMVYFILRFDEGLVWEPHSLPKGWAKVPAGTPTAYFGDAWFESGRSAVMRVPSAIVPNEFNYLLNPLHKDFRKIQISKPRSLKVDPRLSGR